MLTYQLPQSDLSIIKRIKACEFATRCDAARAAGGPASFITNLRRRAIESGLVDPEDWERSFRTMPGTGKRGKDRRPRKTGSGGYPRPATSVKSSSLSAMPPIHPAANF